MMCFRGSRRCRTRGGGTPAHFRSGTRFTPPSEAAEDFEQIPCLMALHCSTLAWKIHGRRSLVGCSPWGREESDTTERLHFHFSLSCMGGGNGTPLQCSCLESPRDGGAWWAAVHGVAQSRTRLKRLSSTSSSIHHSILSAQKSVWNVLAARPIYVKLMLSNLDKLKILIICVVFHLNTSSSHLVKNRCTHSLYY